MGCVLVLCCVFSSMSPPPSNLTAPALQTASLPDSGEIEPGSIYFLKGAARIQTAMAVVVALHRMGHEVWCGPNRLGWEPDLFLFLRI